LLFRIGTFSCLWTTELLVCKIHFLHNIKFVHYAPNCTSMMPLTQTRLCWAQRMSVSLVTNWALKMSVSLVTNWALRMSVSLVTNWALRMSVSCYKLGTENVSVTCYELGTENVSVTCYKLGTENVSVTHYMTNNTGIHKQQTAFSCSDIYPYRSRIQGSEDIANPWSNFIFSWASGSSRYRFHIVFHSFSPPASLIPNKHHKIWSSKIKLALHCEDVISN